MSASINKQKTGKLALIYTLLILGALCFMIPFIWMLSSSLKELPQIFVFPPQWIPKPVRWDNYARALLKMNFPLALKNTLIITVFTVTGQLLSSACVAYGFARLRFPGRELLFMLVISTMMLPSQVTMIPVFIIFKTLGWVDTLKPLIVPSFLGANTFAIFLLRQFFLTIPKELEDAARIDGCGSLRIFFQIMMPLAKPALVTVGIFAFMGSWNDFFGPLIYLNSESLRTLAIALQTFQGQFTAEWNLLMAASVVVLLPVLMIFFILQRYFVQGIVLTGLK
jgi:ABC-type glycerol-3-phosphate transport system permease component